MGDDIECCKSPRKKTDGDGRQLSPEQAAAAAMVAEALADRVTISTWDDARVGREMNGPKRIIRDRMI
jgi:hypothetical protein